jgi:hypothetical protein
MSCSSCSIARLSFSALLSFAASGSGFSFLFPADVGRSLFLKTNPLLNSRLATSDPAVYVEVPAFSQLDAIEIALVESLALRPILIAAISVMTFRNRQRAQSLRIPSIF